MNSAADAIRERLRIAVSGSDAAGQNRLADLIIQCGHQLVDLSASPDAVLADGAVDNAGLAPTVALGMVDEECDGLLPAEANVAQIDAALRAVAVGLTVRAPVPQRRSFGPFPEESPALLSPREIEVLVALSNGLSNKETARRLGISPHTVKFHIESLFRKFGASSRAEVVAKGLKQQIVEF